MPLAWTSAGAYSSSFGESTGAPEKSTRGSSASQAISVRREATAGGFAAEIRREKKRFQSFMTTSDSVGIGFTHKPPPIGQATRAGAATAEKKVAGITKNLPAQKCAHRVGHDRVGCKQNNGNYSIYSRE